MVAALIEDQLGIELLGELDDVRAGQETGVEGIVIDRLILQDGAGLVLPVGSAGLDAGVADRNGRALGVIGDQRRGDGVERVEGSLFARYSRRADDVVVAGVQAVLVRELLVLIAQSSPTRPSI